MPRPSPLRQPVVVHQIEALRDAGCDEVVLAINYQPAVRAGRRLLDLSKTLGCFDRRGTPEGRARGACFTPSSQRGQGSLFGPSPCLSPRLRERPRKARTTTPTCFASFVNIKAGPPLAPFRAPQVMKAFIEEWEPKLGIRISISQETEPMGTAGPLVRKFCFALWFFRVLWG